MAFQTPQLEEPVYQPQMQAPPMAEGVPNQNPPSTAAGFVPKAGAYAYVANGILDGWLQGRKIAAERQMQHAQKELGSLWSNYADQRNQWRAIATEKGPNSPEAQRAYQDATVSWDAYNSGRAKYVMPPETDEKGKKKGVGAKIKHGAANAFGLNITPELFAQQAIKMAAGHPEGLYLSPEVAERQQEQQRAEQERAVQEKQAEEKAAVQKTFEEQQASLKAAQSLPKENRTREQQGLVEADFNAKYAAMATVDPKKAADMKVLHLHDEGQAIPEELKEIAGLKAPPLEKGYHFKIGNKEYEEKDGEVRELAEGAPGAGRGGGHGRSAAKGGDSEAKELKLEKQDAADVNLAVHAMLGSLTPEEQKGLKYYFLPPEASAKGNLSTWRFRGDLPQSKVNDPQMAAKITNLMKAALKARGKKDAEIEAFMGRVMPEYQGKMSAPPAEKATSRQEQGKAKGATARRKGRNGKWHLTNDKDEDLGLDSNQAG